jgi:hypothetical protein
MLNDGIERILPVDMLKGTDINVTCYDDIGVGRKMISFGSGQLMKGRLTIPYRWGRT